MARALRWTRKHSPSCGSKRSRANRGSQGIDRPRTTSTPPKIGELWTGRGGIYVGLAAGGENQPDRHVILADGDREDIAWKDALAWAKGLEFDGLSDFRLPTRREQALLFA